MDGSTVKHAARCFCESSEKCSDCPANSDAEHCLIRAIMESPMDSMTTMRFLINYATCNPVVAFAEGSVT